MPGRDEVELPLRGKPLRDKIVLRVIAVDRALHVVILTLLAVAVFLIASHEAQLRERFYRCSPTSRAASPGARCRRATRA